MKVKLNVYNDPEPKPGTIKPPAEPPTPPIKL